MDIKDVPVYKIKYSINLLPIIGEHIENEMVDD